MVDRGVPVSRLKGSWAGATGGRDQIDGGNGDDIIYGGTNTNYEYGDAGNDHLFKLLCDAIKMPALANDPRFLTNELRHEHVDALEQELETVLLTSSVEDWLDLLNEAGVPGAPINDIAHVIADPEIAGRRGVKAYDRWTQ